MNALPTRANNGNFSNDPTAPPCFCTTNVITHEATASPNSGIFSTTSFNPSRQPCALPSGQKSSNKSTNGSVTTIGLLISPHPNATNTDTYRQTERNST